MQSNIKKNYVAVIGGSVSGSQAAYILADKGYSVVVFEMNNLPYGKIEDGFPNVFAIGNAVTGKGNIRESKKYGVLMTNKIIDDHIQTRDFFEEWLSVYNEGIEDDVKDQVCEIENEILVKNSMPESVFQNISDKTKAYQEKVRYNNYQDWIQSKVPVRLENMK